MIHIRSLIKRFGDACVLNGIDMEIKAGEVAAIVGPSGGGKSTLLRCVNGLETFQEGSVQVEQVTLEPEATKRASSDTLRQIRRRVGMVFQQFHLFPHLTVLENVMSGPLYVLHQKRDEAEPAARALLQRVGMIEKAAAKPDELSGGQQQRVAIARALAMRPQAILFDEPTSALDPRMAAEVLAVIADLAKSGQTMVVVTHAMGFARRVAHTIHVMHEGRVAESGPPEQIFGSPRQEVTRSFLAEAKGE